jgi:hypothetical protein
LTFLITRLRDCQSFAGLHIDEVLLVVFEDLPPFSIGVPDLHIFGGTRMLDVPWLFKEAFLWRLDGLCFLVKPPYLSV